MAPGVKVLSGSGYCKWARSIGSLPMRNEMIPAALIELYVGFIAAFLRDFSYTLEKIQTVI